MLYKPEHVVDLDSGAIVDVGLRLGDEGDTEQLTVRIAEAVSRLHEVMDQAPDAPMVQAVVADKGYFQHDQVADLQQVGIEPVIPAPERKWNWDKMSEGQQAAILRAEAVVQSDGGKRLMKDRAELVERSFHHVLDCGGLRRTALRGRINIWKRQLLGGLFYNLSLLMRRLFGIGTYKQSKTLFGDLVFVFLCALIVLIEGMKRVLSGLNRKVTTGKFRTTGNCCIQWVDGLQIA